MKIATLKDSTRDGRLVVVSKDLTRCSEVGHIARTLQAALDDWAYVGPRLGRVAEGLETGAQPTMRFHEQDAASPLPRAYQWIDGAADAGQTEPLLQPGGSGSFVAPRDPIAVAEEGWGIDIEGKVAVIVDDVPKGTSLEEARAAIRLILLVNDVALRDLAPAASAVFHSRLSPAFSPVAVTPDELGDAWRDGKLHLPLLVSLNGQPLGRADAGVDRAFDFGQLIAHAARTRPLTAGSIVGSGTVSNRFNGGAARPVAEGGAGYSSIADARNVETQGSGAAKTPFLKFGDTVRIEMKDKAGHSIFGAIEQAVQRYERA